MDHRHNVLELGSSMQNVDHKCVNQLVTLSFGPNLHYAIAISKWDIAITLLLAISVIQLTHTRQEYKLAHIFPKESTGQRSKNGEFRRAEDSTESTVANEAVHRKKTKKEERVNRHITSATFVGEQDISRVYRLSLVPSAVSRSPPPPLPANHLISQ